MVSDVDDASASPFPSTIHLAQELDILIDFVADDGRPTFVLDDATTEIVYRNTAFDSFLATASRTWTVSTWLTSLLEAARNAPRSKPRTTQELGSFANRPWSRKSIGSSWTAVICLEQTHSHRSSEDAPTPSSDKKISSQIPTVDTVPLKRHESDNASITSVSTCASSLGTADMDTPFEDLTVDWLLYPKPTADPWLEFVLNHDWQDKTVGPIQSWPTMLRQMYTTILAPSLADICAYS